MLYEFGQVKTTERYLVYLNLVVLKYQDFLFI